MGSRHYIRIVHASLAIMVMRPSKSPDPPSLNRSSAGQRVVIIGGTIFHLRKIVTLGIVSSLLNLSRLMKNHISLNTNTYLELLLICPAVSLRGLSGLFECQPEHSPN
jgi:hypothetical protein